MKALLAASVLAVALFGMSQVSVSSAACFSENCPSYDGASSSPYQWPDPGAQARELQQRQFQEQNPNYNYSLPPSQQPSQQPTYSPAPKPQRDPYYTPDIYDQYDGAGNRTVCHRVGQTVNCR